MRLLKPTENWLHTKNNLSLRQLEYFLASQSSLVVSASQVAIAVAIADVQSEESFCSAIVFQAALSNLLSAVRRLFFLSTHWSTSHYNTESCHRNRSSSITSCFKLILKIFLNWSNVLIWTKSYIQQNSQERKSVSVVNDSMKNYFKHIANCAQGLPTYKRLCRQFQIYESQKIFFIYWNYLFIFNNHCHKIHLSTIY